MSAKNTAIARQKEGPTDPKAGPGPRAKKRLMVRYGVSAPEITAFINNLSKGGLCIKTTRVVRPGTNLELEIHTPDRTFTMRGQVVWAKKVPPGLLQVPGTGMGLRLIDPGPEWIEFCARWTGNS